MNFFTIGYGGRPPTEFLDLLMQNQIRTVADIRLRPERASMGSYVLAKSPEKGIQGLLSRAGIAYFWCEALGNPFLGEDEWQDRYRELIHAEGETRCQKLFELEAPMCLMCAEKKTSECHRLHVANFLIEQGHKLEAHL